MKLLLDTHNFLWFISGDTRLSINARILIEDVSNQLVVSIVSLCEIAIKVSIGKLNLVQPFDILIPQQIRLNEMELLGISFSHTVEVAALPLNHRDPFDRLLIAQARVEKMPIISCDTAFDTYDIERLW